MGIQERLHGGPCKAAGIRGDLIMVSKKKNGGKVFLWIYLSLTALLLAAIAFGLIRLWGFLKEYESTQQCYVTDAVLSELNGGNYTKIYEGLDELKAEISPYETEEALREQISRRLTGEFTLAKSAKYSTEDAPVYMLKCGGENAALLSLKKVSKTPEYGLDVFGFDKIYGLTAQRSERAEVKIPSNCAFTVNGKSPDGEFFTEERIPEAKYFGDFLNGEPTILTYAFGGLMNPPDIRFYNAKGKAIPVSFENGVYSSPLPTLDEEAAKAAETFASEFAKEYSKFVSHDSSFEKLIPYIPRGTKFYNDLRTFEPKYYTPHTGFEFRNEKLPGTTQYSENCFSVSLEYDHVIDYYGKEITYHTSFTVYTVNTPDKGWQAVNLVIN